jgi:AmmeMemoRadiSam system protein A
MPVLSSNSQQALLALARESIERYLEDGSVPSFRCDGGDLSQKMGCFVTLRLSSGELRGCVGTFERERPLWENVSRMARCSAFQDTRFSPVKKAEMENLVIEISVLGPLEPVAGIESIELGRHGIVTRFGSRSGTLLPQVALEQGWTREQFVTYCAIHKAGLSPAECAQAELLIYEVSHFAE